MNLFLNFYKTLEKTFASLKFAAVIISVFALALIWGTFVESYNGTDFAGRLIYKSWWFIALEICMFLSILMATIVRLPPKKSLYGFYTIHLGLMILFFGAAITYINGIDGSIDLKLKSPSNKIIINEDVLKIHLLKENKVIEYALPYVAKKVELNAPYKNMTLGTYLPFSKNKTIWQKSIKQIKESSIDLTLYNENFNENVILSMHPNADFKSTKKLGLLSFHFMPKNLHDCFIRKTKTGYLIWNAKTDECKTSEQMGIETKKSPLGTDFLSFKYQNKTLKFFPNFSPMAVKDDLTKDESTPFRVFSKKLFTKKPNLFIFGKKAVFYKKGLKTWKSKVITKNKPISLPWMNFKLYLNKYSDSSYPTQIPSYAKPLAKTSDQIENDTKAIKVKFGKTHYWVRSDAPLSVTNSIDTMNFIITKKSIDLPYQITLKQFVMKTNPGTKNAASYESFVDLLDPSQTTGATKHHVYMNEPLKYDQFTFYQSSYYKDKNGDYASVFSVNYDPGRTLKYLGSLLLVLGSIWHYIIRRKKKRKKDV
ncbi:MAG: cytochrome c biogenesis protein ResB [Bacteriovoracaceae bacterium]|nr:cytochrome c biogenesis protein ResB [Bacteriovoracaceae bacterium]